jgi:hypothetical protein
LPIRHVKEVFKIRMKKIIKEVAVKGIKIKNDDIE